MSAQISALGVALSKSGYTLETPDTMTLAILAVVVAIGVTRFTWNWLKAWLGEKHGK